MEAARVPHLHLVDVETGERFDLDECPNCQVMQDKLDGATKDIQAWSVRYANLKRDKEADARGDRFWPDGVELFRLYCRLTGTADRPRRLTWSAERFELVRPFLAKHGSELCVRAIVGRVTDHFTARRANGTTIHYHEWERIFGGKGNGQTCASNFEESCNRAPHDWRERAAEAGWEWPENESAPAE